jgi:hypothetical protein
MITRAGVKALGEFTPLPRGRALYEYWLRELGESGAARMLAVIRSRGPISREQLAEETGIALTGGTFRTYLGKLKTLELVRENLDRLMLNPELR